MLIFLGEELKNAACFFTIFANVNRDDKNETKLRNHIHMKKE